MCHCDLVAPFEQCCEPYITQQKTALDALTLMRSRYSAFCVNNSDYLALTCSAQALANNPRHEVEEFANSVKFVGLTIVQSQLDKQPAIVEFKANYIFDDALQCIHERSSFIEQDGRLKYDRGQLFEVPSQKLKRNDPCPCSSGKKYKKCCG